MSWSSKTSESWRRSWLPRCKEHYDVVVAATGEDGFYRVNAERFDMVVLDLMLPGRSGLEILQTLRQRHIDTPVLILMARDGIDDRVRGLDFGADDYLVKPFALPELLARIRALLRRGRPSDVLRLKADRPHQPRVRSAGVLDAASWPSRLSRNAGA
jgi:DNA-binding response OmpR family regulator